MIDVLVVILMVILCIGLVILITTFMTKRAMYQVIRIMKLSGAVNPEGARTINELRLNPPPLRERLMKMRDYKPKALQLRSTCKLSNTMRTAGYSQRAETCSPRQSSNAGRHWPKASSKNDLKNGDVVD